MYRDGSLNELKRVIKDIEQYNKDVPAAQRFNFNVTWNGQSLVNISSN